MKKKVLAKLGVIHVWRLQSSVKDLRKPVSLKVVQITLWSWPVIFMNFVGRCVTRNYKMQCRQCWTATGSTVVTPQQDGGCHSWLSRDRNTWTARFPTWPRPRPMSSDPPPLLGVWPPGLASKTEAKENERKWNGPNETTHREDRPHRNWRRHSAGWGAASGGSEQGHITSANLVFKREEMDNMVMTAGFSLGGDGWTDWHRENEGCDQTGTVLKRCGGSLATTDDDASQISQRSQSLRLGLQEGFWNSMRPMTTGRQHPPHPRPERRQVCHVVLLGPLPDFESRVVSLSEQSDSEPASERGTRWR